MSRIGKKPVPVPEGVKVNIESKKILYEGPKGKLESPLFPGISAVLEASNLIFTRKDDSGQLPAFHGLVRALAANSVTGVTQGFSVELEIVGVGYRGKINKGQLELNLGYSKPVIYEIPDDIEVEMAKPNAIKVMGMSKQRVGQEAQKIRSFRTPDPYKLKGIRYKGERLIKKERKAGVSGV
ncbi:MAG: 50S ribosomal protein L6 [Candidatus Aminicenantes bacterium]